MITTKVNARDKKNPRKKVYSFKQKKERAAYIFIIPVLIGLIGFTLYPMLLSLYYAMTDKVIGRNEINFIGLENFKYMFTEDPLFFKALKVTFQFSFFSVPVTLFVAFIFAILLNQKVKGLAFFRTIFYIPTIVPAIANSVLWMWVFNPQFGVLNSLLGKIGIEPLGWIYVEETAILSLVIMSAWGFGAKMIIFLAGLQGIPSSLYEAADIDGASPLKKILHVTLPLMTPIIFFNLVMAIIETFQTFSLAYVMTKGGPNFATYFFNYHLYEQAFTYGRMGYASALAWVLFFIVAIFTAITFITRKYWVYNE